MRPEGRGDVGIVRSVRLARSAFRAMIEESERRLPNETGGFLVGRFDGGLVEVALVVGPGPGAIHRPGYVRRDGEFSQRELDSIYGRFAGRYDYVGEWHSHTLPAGPSPRDRRSMRWVAASEAYNLEHPVLIIYQRSWRRSWRLLVYQWTGSRLLRLPATVRGATPAEVGELRGS